MEKEKKIIFDKEKILGNGAYGYVFKGKCNGQEAAVKRIDQNRRCDDREEQALKVLNHPNVVKLLEVEDDDNFR